MVTRTQNVVKVLGFLTALGWMLLLPPAGSTAGQSGDNPEGGGSSSKAPHEEISDQAHEALRDLSSYLTEAALRNAELEAAFYRWKASLEKIPQVTALPDPRFTFAYYFQSVETRVGPQLARLALFQTFPWFGTLDLKGDIASQEANALKAQYDALKLKVFFEVKNAFYEYAYLAQAVAITGDDIELLRYLEGVIRARYAAGAIPYSDVLKTQVQLGRLEDRLNTLKDLRKPIMAKLAAAMNRPMDSQLPWPSAVPVMQISMTDKEVIGQLTDSNPQLKRYEHLEEKEKASVELARKQYYPEMTFGVEDIITASAMNPATPDSGQDAIIGSLTINIPFWWEKRKAAVRESRTALLATQRSAESLKQNLISDVELAFYKYRDAHRKIELYRDTLIPKAEESLGVTLEAFQAGTRSSLDLIDAEKTLLEFELSYIRALADQAQRLAELEMLLGKEIPCRIHGTVLPKHRIEGEKRSAGEGADSRSKSTSDGG